MGGFAFSWRIIPKAFRIKAPLESWNYQITDIASLPELAQWPGLQSVIVVETIRMAHQRAPVTSDYRVYISSLVRSATAFVTMIRQHWDIENKLHWSLDVAFNEDRCRIRKDHAPQGDRILIPCNDVDRRLESDLIIGS